MLLYPTKRVVKFRNQEDIINTLYKSLVEASQGLPEDAANALFDLRYNSTGHVRIVLDAIYENINKSSELSLPLCQDTGMGWFFINIPKNLGLDIKEIVYTAFLKATQEGNFRPSVVKHPLLRTNTNNNLPVIIHENLWDGPLEILFYLRGFGSENAGASFLMKPTDSFDDIVKKIKARILEVGGAACPPIFIGIGIGGTLDFAALLAKKALFREVGVFSEHPLNKELEMKIFNEINELPIGPGGIGKGQTVLWVAVESFPTHIAGLPVVLAVSCWADRRGIIVFEEDHQ